MAKLTDVLDVIDPDKRPVAASLCTEISFMRRELVKLRKEISANGCTELFQQGKNQFTRQTPAFCAYVSLIARYGSLNRQLISLMPKGAVEQGDELDEFIQELRG